MIRFIYYFIPVILFLAGCAKKEESPNILLIMTDDQAYGDLSMTDNPYTETPVLDQLAKDGAFASNFYVSPVCAPTRASLLTGRYHQRTGVSGVTRGREDMKLDETTLADIYKSFGYQTGAFGKWHNGAHYPYHPLGRGFDEFVGFTSGHWSNYFDTTIEKNGKPFKTSGYLTDVLTDEAIDFMQRASKSNKPFFCYVPYQTPHTPLQVPDKYFDKYKAKGLDDFNACIYGMCENIDDNVGRMIKHLEANNLLENTIVIYLSDNGPLNYRFNHQLKGKKGSNNEGGVRVPFIINWAEHINKGDVLETPLAHIDILPTLLELTGHKYDHKKPVDGISFAEALKEGKPLHDRFLFGEWSGRERVLADPYLLVQKELFDIRKDPQQKQNIRNELPQVYDSLFNAYQTWVEDIDFSTAAQKPIPVGYEAYPTTVLPAHEANLFPPFEARKDRRHTGIAYHSLYGWAHDWIDFWTNTEAYAEWQIEVVNEGDYELELYYALGNEDIGTKLQLEIGESIVEFTVTESYVHSEFEKHDRVHRDQEAPETDWAKLSIGKVKLKKGKFNVAVKALEILGEKTIELKELHLKKSK